MVLNDESCASANNRATSSERAPYGLRQWSGWVLGPAALLLTLLAAPPEGLSIQGWRTAGAALLMAIFWITEPSPIPATALLPLVRARCPRNYLLR